MSHWKPVSDAIPELGTRKLFVSPTSNFGRLDVTLFPVKLGEGEEGCVTIMGDAIWKQDQIFRKEDLGKWFLTLHSGKVYAFPERVTSRLVLSGVRGVEEGAKFLTQICTLYEDKTLGETPIPMPLELWKKLPGKYREVAHWFVEYYEHGFEAGLLIARNGELGDGVLLKEGNTVLNAYGVRPVIPMKDGVEVDLDSDRVNGLTLRFR